MSVVRFHPEAPKTIVLHMIDYGFIRGSGSVVERHLAKVNVASSNLVFRSMFQITKDAFDVRLLLFVITKQKRRHSQEVRQRSAKPLFPGSNPGGASNRKMLRLKNALRSRHFFTLSQ